MKKSKMSSFIFILTLALSVVAVYQSFQLNGILPWMNYVIGFLLLLLSFVLYRGSFKNQSKIIRFLSKTLLGILAISLAVGNFTLYKYGSILNGLIGQDIKKDTVSIIVRKDSEYLSLEDVKDKTFMIEDAHEDIVMEAMKKFNKDIKHVIKTADSPDYETMVEGLFNEKYDVIVVNEAYRSLIYETYPNFSEDTKVIAEYHKESFIESSNVNVTKDTFSVMITGIDVYGNITNNARSDVNILAVVNPKSKKIMLVSIPRDYYLPMACQNDAMDKLTHTGIYGVDCTMDTVGRLFDVDVDFYVRVNFTSLVTIVDAVGGVDVYNEHYFNVGDMQFYEGHNVLSGAEALTFVRDREHQGDGDSARGRHQVQVLTSIINKVMSPQILTNFNSLLNAVDGSFQTNMSNNDINSLVKMQLKDMADWEIIQEQVSGDNAYEYSYALGGVYYVMIPHMDSVERVKEKIEALDFD